MALRWGRRERFLELLSASKRSKSPRNPVMLRFSLKYEPGTPLFGTFVPAKPRQNSKTVNIRAGDAAFGRVLMKCLFFYFLKNRSSLSAPFCCAKLVEFENVGLFAQAFRDQGKSSGAEVQHR